MSFSNLQMSIYKVTNSLRVPMSAALLIEIFSSLQIIQLIFSSMAKFSPSSHFIIRSLNKNLPFLTGAFQLEADSGYHTIFHSVWIICLIYFFSHLLFLMIAIMLNKNSNHGGQRVIKILSWLYLLHSRILFFPIQFFLLNICNLYSFPTKDPSDVKFYQRGGWLAGSVALLVINAALVLCKEFLMYQINHIEGDTYAVKTNIYHQTMAVYKIIALLLYSWGLSGTSDATKGSAVFHLIMGLILLLVLYIKLPFYQFSLLKLTIKLTTMMLCFSMISVIYVFVAGEDSEMSGGLHVLILLLPPLGIKLVLSQFQSLFKRILLGEFLFQDHAIHFGLLLEDFLAKEKVNWRDNDESFFPNPESYYGTLAGNKIPIENFADKKLIHECELPIYSHIIEKLSSVPSSSNALALYIAQICLTKGDSIPKTLEIMRKLEASSNSSFSFPLRSSIQYMNDLLEKVYKEDGFGSDLRLGLSHYFKYYDIANSVKTLMLAETNKQIEFWEEIKKRDLDAKKIYDKVEEIDQIFVRIRKECELNLNNFRKNFTSPMLLYAVYLNNVRQMHYEGIQILRSFQSIMFAQSGNDELEAASAAGNVAVVIVSLDKAKAGTILNASGSIHNIFNFRKTELIGKKYGCLFPSSIAKVYMQSFQQYAKAPEYKLDHKERTYGKTSNNEIFELEGHLQFFPYVNKELTLMIMFRKLDEPAPVLIANSEGVIVDCSKTLESLFLKESLNVKTFHSLKDLNSGFEDVNLAFNTVYGQNSQQVQSTVVTKDTKPWFNFDNTDIDYEESARGTGRSLLHGYALTPDRTQTFAPQPTGMQMYRAERICEEYQEGKQTILCSERKSPFRALVSIKPFKYEEEIFKIVRISNFKKETGTLFESSNDEDDDNGIQTFGDEFPADQEKVIVKKVSKVKTPKNKGGIGSSFAVKEKISWRTDSEASVDEKNREQMDKTQQKFDDLQQIWDQDDQRSSVMNSHHLESRAVRTLRDIGSRQKLQRSLCSLQFALYFVIIVVLLLSYMKFELSKSSIEEIEKGINIINLATLRLQNVINTFLWSLVIVTGVNPSQAFEYFTANMAKFTETSIKLEHEVGLATNKKFINRSFQKDVKFWQLPVLGDTKNEMIIDTFAATNILMGKYLAIQEAQSIYEIYMMPDLPLIFNNTANDYIISSNNFISATDKILDEIISTDIVLLKVILAIEIVALFGYTFIFISMIYIISQSYQKLCRALMRTQDISIVQRISQLKKVKILLEDDLERKAFIQDGFDLFIEERSLNRESNVKAQMATHQSHLKMSSMNKYLIRIAIICLLFIPVFTALFVGALVKSINGFTSLESVNEELAVLSYGSLQSNLMMSTIIYASMNAAFPSMLVMNKPPAVQTAENLANFNGLNQKLIETFLSSKEREIDPYLVEILQSNVCKHLNDEYKVVCQYATNSQKMGLLSVNTDYYNMLKNIIMAVGLSISLADALVIYASVVNKIIGEMSVMMEIYPIMMSHVIEGFEETVRSSKNDEEKYIILIFVIVGVYVVFIYLKPLKDFQRVDVGRRKILKIIPADIIQGNKAMKFYLMQDFKTEIEEIKNSL